MPTYINAQGQTVRSAQSPQSLGLTYDMQTGRWVKPRQTQSVANTNTTTTRPPSSNAGNVAAQLTRAQRDAENKARIEAQQARDRAQLLAARERRAAAQAATAAAARYRTQEAAVGDAEAYVQSLIDGRPNTDAESIAASAQLLTPKPSAEMQAAIDYATSLIQDSDSTLRRMIDGDYDFTYFNQGVVEPLRNEQGRIEEEIMSQFTGGDARGRAGGVTSGAARAAASSSKKQFSDAIAGLRAQEYNNMLTRSMDATGILGGLMSVIDNRGYDQVGLEAAIQAAGLDMQGWGASLDAAMGMAQGRYGLQNTAMNNLTGAEANQVGVETGIANRMSQMDSQFGSDLMAMLSRFSSDNTSFAANVMDIQSRDWTTLLERDFAYDMAARDDRYADVMLSSIGQGAPTSTYGSRSSSLLNSTPPRSMTYQPNTGPRRSTNKRTYAQPTVHGPQSI